MRTIFKIFILLFLLLILIESRHVFAQNTVPDTIKLENINSGKQAQFYDSLKYKADQRKLTRLIYEFLISPPRPYVDKKALAINYYADFFPLSR